MGPLFTSGWSSRVRVSITFSRRQHRPLELLHAYLGAVNLISSSDPDVQRENLLAASTLGVGRSVSSPKSACLEFRHSSRALLARRCSEGTLGTQHHSR